MSYTDVNLGLRVNVRVPSWIPSVTCVAPSTDFAGEPPSVRIVVTYGWPHHPTSPVDTPLVAIAVTASAARAMLGKDVSMTNMNGVRALARPRDDREKIFSERKVRLKGPW